MINRRIFGSDINNRVKGILKARQAVASDPKPTESIQLPSTNIVGDTTYTEHNINEFLPDSQVNFSVGENTSLVDLYSRTPFIRMWTSVSVIEDLTPEDEFFEPDFVDTTNMDKDSAEAAKEVAKNDAKIHADDFMNDNLGTLAPQWSSKAQAWIVRWKDNHYQKSEKYDKIYQLGNYDIGTLELTPNASIQQAQERMRGGTETDDDIENIATALTFPNEHESVQIQNDGDGEEQLLEDRNQFLKPQAGITGLTSSTEGRLGAIKKTTINFTVHNFHDFSNIFQRYFLRPGAQLFVDWGWDTAALYDPELIVNDTKRTEAGFNSMEGVLYAELSDYSPDANLKPDGYVTRSMGNMESIVGMVTNYDAKALSNGSWECMVEITSKNMALLGNEFGEGDLTSARIQYIIDNVIYYHALLSVIQRQGSCFKNAHLDETIEGDTSNDPANPVGDKGMIIIEHYCNEVGGHWVEAAPQAQVDLMKKYQPNSEWSFSTRKKWQEKLIEILTGDKLNFSSTRALTPGGDSVISGVFISTMNNVNNTYLSWGVIEDLIINPEFGFGKNLTHINTSEEFVTRLDSKNSFTTYDNTFVYRQTTIANSTGVDTRPVILMPDVNEFDPTDNPYNSGQVNVQKSDGLNKTVGWDDTYNLREGKSPSLEHYMTTQAFLDKALVKDGHMSLTEWNEKYSSDAQLTSVDMSDTTDPSSPDDYNEQRFARRTELDLLLNRIPLREVFVKAEIVINAFKGQGTVPQAIQNILKKINDDSYGIYDWRIANMGGDDTKLAIVDNNVLDSEKRQEMSLSNADGDNQEFENMFEFTIMGEKSIVSSYDLSFTMPQGAYGNMLAIQGGGNKQLYPTTEILDTIMSLEQLQKAGMGDNSYVKYNPSIGRHRYETIYSDSKYASHLDGAYDRTLEVITANEMQWRNPKGIKFPSELIYDNIKKSSNTTQTSRLQNNQVSKEHDTIIQKRVDFMRANGFHVVESWKEYFKYTSTGKFYQDMRPTPLPMYLSLTMYGISSLVPGDIFKIDYLPKRYQKKVYFQVMKISHKVDSSGWDTTLETQFRTRAVNKKEENQLYAVAPNVYFSPKVLEDETDIPAISSFDMTTTYEDIDEKRLKEQGKGGELLRGEKYNINPNYEMDDVINKYMSRCENLDIDGGMYWFGTSFKNLTELMDKVKPYDVNNLKFNGAFGGGGWIRSAYRFTANDLVGQGIDVWANTLGRVVDMFGRDASTAYLYDDINDGTYYSSNELYQQQKEYFQNQVTDTVASSGDNQSETTNQVRNQRLAAAFVHDGLNKDKNDQVNYDNASDDGYWWSNKASMVFTGWGSARYFHTYPSNKDGLCRYNEDEGLSDLYKLKCCYWLDNCVASKGWFEDAWDNLTSLTTAWAPYDIVGFYHTSPMWGSCFGASSGNLTAKNVSDGCPRANAFLEAGKEYIIIFHLEHWEEGKPVTSPVFWSVLNEIEAIEYYDLPLYLHGHGSIQRFTHNGGVIEEAKFNTCSNYWS